MPKLIIQLANEEWTADLTTGSNVLGRASQCTIPIKDNTLSRQHCDVVYVGGSATVVDKGSMNGTLVNGKKIASEQPLQPGDRITIGATTIWYEKKFLAVERKPATAEARRSSPSNAALAAQPAGASTQAPTRRTARPAGPAPGATPVPAGAPGPARATAPARAPAPAPVRAPARAASPASEVEEVLQDYSYHGRGGGSYGKVAAIVAAVVAVGIVAYFARGLGGGTAAKVDDVDNLIKNGSFEGQSQGRPENWQVRTPLASADRISSTLGIDLTQGRGGGACMVLEKAAASSDLVVECVYSDAIAVGKGESLEVGAWTRFDGFSGSVAFKVDWLKAAHGPVMAEEYGDRLLGAASWAQLRASFAPPPGAQACRLALSAIGRSGRIAFDDISGKLGSQAASREYKLGPHRATSTRQGVLVLTLKNRLSLSGIGVRLESEREGATAQAQAAPAQITEEENGLVIKGKVLSPVDLREIEFEERVSFQDGWTEVFYQFRGESLRQIDRPTIGLVLPRSEGLRGMSEKPNQPTGRVSYSTDEGDLVIEYDPPARLRTRSAEGRLRVFQSFPFEPTTEEIGFGFKVRESGSGDQMDPRTAIRKAREDGRLGEAITGLREGSRRTKDAAEREQMEQDIRLLEETEKREWTEVQSVVFQAELSRRADQKKRADEALANYQRRWAGEGQEAKAAALAESLRKELQATPDPETLRPRAIFDRAKKYAEEGHKALAQSMLQALIQRYPSSEVASEADKLRKSLSQ